MNEKPPVHAVIVDYGLGNLYSVKSACEHVGMQASISSDKKVIREADVVILPGVGAYGDAMAELERRDLVEVLQETASLGKPLVGICLGMQLLMSESFEFGQHAGLNIVPGSVVHFGKPKTSAGIKLKVPQVGWNRVWAGTQKGEKKAASWEGTPLQGMEQGAFMYFVHSYYCVPTDPGVVLGITRYGDVEFCSSLRTGNIFATQFHPERSGPVGINIYRQMVEMARKDDV